MSENERTDYAAGKINEITTVISGKTFAFSSDFRLQVMQYVEFYAKRVGNKRKNGAFTEDLGFVLQRGEEVAPMINKSFDRNGVARLSGLYMAMLESEFDANLKSPTGNFGIFQINNARAQKYGLKPKDRANVEKAADAATRYLKANQDYFAGHKMNEFLAILS